MVSAKTIRPAFKPPKALRKADKRLLTPLGRLQLSADATVIDRIWDLVERRRVAGSRAAHSGRLLAKGSARMTRKLGEEVVECTLEAVAGNRPETVLESADVIYHLVVLWVDAGIAPQEIWNELAQRDLANL